MAEIVDRAYLEIDGEIIDCDSIDDKVTGNKEPRKVMNRQNRPIAHKHGQPEYSISAEFPMDLALSTKFNRLLEENTSFTTTIEYSGQDGSSRIVSYLKCEVYEVNASAKEGDSATISLEIGSLDRIETNS